MAKKPTYEELEQRVKELENEALGRKQVEEELRESEEKYRIILENIEDGYYELDLAGNFTFFNDASSKILGYAKAEMMGMSYRQYIDPEISETVFNEMNSVYKTGNPVKRLEWEIIRKDGTIGVMSRRLCLS